MFEALGSRVRSRLIPAVRLRAALAQMAPLCLILQVVVYHPNLVVAQEDSRVPALIEALRDPNPTVQQSAAQALGRMGPEAKAAVTA
jgi:HEAT repeat protein